MYSIVKFAVDPIQLGEEGAGTGTSASPPKLLQRELPLTDQSAGTEVFLGVKTSQ